MERLWSPWRSEHVRRWANMEGADGLSIFESLAREEDDENNLILWRAEHWFVVLNLYPYNNGHSLIVPFRKVREFTDLTLDEQVELAPLIDRVMRWTKEALSPDGFNVGINQGEAGGAGIPEHLHVHLVPRWQSDTNFMPTTAQTKVVPEALRATFAKLRAAAHRMEPRLGVGG